MTNYLLTEIKSIETTTTGHAHQIIYTVDRPLVTGIQVQALHDIRVVFWLLPKLHAFTTYIEYNTLLHTEHYWTGSDVAATDGAGSNEIWTHHSVSYRQEIITHIYVVYAHALFYNHDVYSTLSSILGTLPY